MSDWNPLGWAALTEEKKQNTFNNLTGGWMKAVDYFNQAMQTGNAQKFRIEKEIPAEGASQFENAKGLYDLAAPERAFDQGIKRDTLDAQKSIDVATKQYYADVLKAQTDERMSQKEKDQAIASAKADFDYSRSQLEEQILRLLGQKDGTSSDQDKQSLIDASIEKYFSKIASDSSYGIIRDLATGMYDFSALRDKPEKVQYIVDMYTNFAPPGLSPEELTRAKKALQQYLMGYQTPQVPADTLASHGAMATPAKPAASGANIGNEFKKFGQGVAQSFTPLWSEAIKPAGEGLASLYKSVTGGGGSQLASIGPTGNYSMSKFKKGRDGKLYYDNVLATKEQIAWYGKNGGK